MPASLHVDLLRPKVDWSAGEVELLAEAEPWPANGHPRRAGVSSFGISGTNAHLILEEAPDSAAAAAARGGEAPLALLPRSRSSSRRRPSRPCARPPGASPRTCWPDPQPELADVAYSPATTRSALEHRAAVPVEGYRIGCWPPSQAFAAAVVGIGPGDERQACLPLQRTGCSAARMGWSCAPRSPVFARGLRGDLRDLRPRTFRGRSRV